MKFWEERDKELTKQSTILEEEINRLILREKEVEKEIMDLDSANLNDKLGVEKQNEQMLQAELTLIRSKLANSETELLQHKNKCHKLNEDISVQKQKQIEDEQEYQEQEKRLLQEIVEVQAQISRSLTQHTEREANLAECTVDVKALDQSLSTKTLEATELEKDIRDINLEMFTAIPPEAATNTEGNFSVASEMNV